MHYWDDREEKKKAQHPGGIQTHDLKSFALQACTLPLPKIIKILKNSFRPLEIKRFENLGILATEKN